MRQTIRALLVAAAAAIALTASAQTLWPAEKMLATVASPTIVVRDKAGQELERFDRAAVERSVVVLQRLAPAFDMQPPALFITPARAPNAFVTRTKDGHPIMGITTGMLRLTGAHDDSLAAVIGHELGHLKARHLTEGAQRAEAVGLLAALLGAAVDVSQARHGRDTGGLGQALGAAGGQLVNAKFSRDQEREADHLGTVAMARAGFDPAAAGNLWGRMAAASGGGSGLWLDDHPSNAERQQTLTGLGRELQSQYAVARAAHPSLVDLLRTDPYPRSAHAALEPTAEEMAGQALYAQGFVAAREKRFEEATALLTSAAESGDERAITMLGVMSHRGLGKPADLEAARTHFDRAAAKGFGPAMRALGDLAGGAQSSQRDHAEAARMYALAHVRGDARATAQLAILQVGGRGIEKDPYAARRLAEKSANAGDKLGRAALATMLRDGVGGAKDQVRGTNDIAAVAPEIAWARFQLAVSYERGLGVSADRERAIQEYELASKAGYAGAKERLRALGR